MRGRSIVHHNEPEDAPEAPAGQPSGTEAVDAATERARRYLDLWERNLSQLSVSGPPPAGSGSRARRGR
jgi:hypothetical protein